MNNIRIQGKVIGPVKNPNCKFTCLQVLQLLVLFPLFSVRNAANYSPSALSKLFACHKDTFYRFMNDGNVDWRCVIIDDTDLPKTGFKSKRPSTTGRLQKVY